MNTFVNNGIVYTENDISRLAEEWKGIVDKAVSRYLSEFTWATEILDDLLLDFANDKLHLDFNKNPQGYIYIAAKRCAINILVRKVIPPNESRCDDEEVENCPDEGCHSPAEICAWESRGELIDYAFDQLIRCFRDNGRIHSPRKCAQILRKYLEGDVSCRKLAEEFHLDDKNYPSILKLRYLRVIQNMIENTEEGADCRNSTKKKIEYYLRKSKKSSKKRDNPV